MADVSWLIVIAGLIAYAQWEGYAASALFGAIGANQQKKAQQRQAEQIAQAYAAAAEAMEQIAGPYTDLAKTNLPRLQAAIQQYYGLRAGKESPILRGEHEKSMADIERQKNKWLSGSQSLWGAKGNVGKAREEAQHIGRETEEAAFGERLGYGKAQETYKAGTISDYIGGMQGLAGLSTAGIQPMMQAAQTRMGGATEAAGLRAGATTGFWGSMGDIYKDISGTAEDQREAERWRKWYEKLPK